MVAAVVEVLRAEREGCLPGPVPEPNVAWSTVRAAAVQHRVVPLLTPHLERLGMPDPDAESMRRRHRTALRNGLAQVADTRLAIAALHAADVPVLAVKGCALATVMGGQPASRGAGDVDLLVQPTDVHRAEDVLRAAGWHQHRALDRSGWRARTLIRRISEWPLEHAERTPIDLHWRLPRWAGEMDDTFEALLGRSVSVPAIGPDVRTLCAADSLRHMSVHGRKELWCTLRHLVDVVRLVAVLGPDAGTVLRNPSVAQAVALASRIAPWLADPAPTCEVDERLVDHLWTGCMSLSLSLPARKQLAGREATRMRWYVESTLWHTAPNRTARRSLLTSRMVPWGMVAGRGGPVPAFFRAVRHSLRGGPDPARG